MHGDFSGIEFLDYLWRQRRIPIAACGSAVVLAAAITWFLPLRYTATATILIEPPAGNDPRAATSVSTVYLESLKTYEHLVTTDTLFAGALDKLGLRSRYAGASVEELKRRMLSVSKPASTSLIEVSATLPNPAEAQRLAQTLAEDAVSLNSSLDQRSNGALLLEPAQIYEGAKTRRERAEQAQAAFLKVTSVLTLDQQVGGASALRAQVNLDLAREQTSLASYKGQRNSTMPKDGEASQAWSEVQIAASSARIQDLEKQQGELTRFLGENVPSIEKLKRQEEAIETELRAARAEEEAASARLRDIQSSSAVRRVRITVLDPGIVPQKPSFPSLPLNAVAAFILALVVSTAYLAFRFSRLQLVTRHEERLYSRV